jgi:hypothetical protein
MGSEAFIVEAVAFKVPDTPAALLPRLKLAVP